MKSPLHILHLEDDPNDISLVQAALAEGGIVCSTTCAQTREDFMTTLKRGDVDLILSDYSLPAFDGLTAIAMVQADWPDLPVILVSGTLGEERAIDSLKSGATDYVLKGRLARLAPAVRRAMEEVEAQAERRRLEAQFIEGQKMEVLGQLAAGVAHDFNNILAIIISCSDMITLKLGPDSVVQKYTDGIKHASERAVGLTRQLLVFIRKETIQPVVLDLPDVVVELEKMLRRLIDENIKMTIEAGKNTGRIMADSGYLGQVLMNLVINARDAMPQGGKLTISTSNVTLDAQAARTVPGAPPGDYVMLKVSDTGTGMTEEVKARLFEAFFTTKPKGKGTGLGLATCRTIVHQSGGYIQVESVVGHGTTFKIYFPCIKPLLSAQTRPAAAGPLPHGTETLLLVEDEPTLRQLARSVLEGQGYFVLSAANGLAALHAAREYRGTPIRLVVTDVVMPLMGGREMAEQLKAGNPELKILFTSGYIDDTITHQGVLESGIEFLSKPYTPAALVRKVREMLDAVPA